MARVYQTIISVLDQLSAPVLAMEKRLEHLGQVGSHAQQQLHAAPHQRLWADLHEHIGGARERVAGFGEQLGEAGSRVSDILPMLAGIGAIGSIAGLVEMVRTTSEASLQLQHMAIIAGVSTQQLQALDYAGGQVGVSSDVLATALGRLNQRLGMAATGQMKPLAEMLKHFGIQTRDANHHLLDAAQVMPQLVKLFSNMKSPVEQNAVAFQLFGRSYQDILPLLDVGVAKFQALQNQFTLFGYSIAPSNFKDLKEFGDAWENVSTATQGFLTEVASKLAPVLTPILNQFSHWIAINRDWIATDIAGAVKNLADMLSNINVKTITTDFQNALLPVQNFVAELGGLGTVLTVVGGIMALRFAAPLLPMATGLMQLVGVLGFATGQVFMVGVSLLRVLPAIRSFRDLWAGISLVMDANPLGVLVIGVGLAVAAAYELYEHWDYVSKELSQAWHWIGSEFDAVFGPIQKTIDQIGNDLGALGQMLPGGNTPAGTPHLGGGNGGVTFHGGGRQGGPFQQTSFITYGGAPADSSGGKVQMEVNFRGAPDGMTVKARSSGRVAAPKMNVGRNRTLEA